MQPGLTPGPPANHVADHIFHQRWPVRSIAERFWSHVEIRGPDECWPWTGALNKYGYGHFRVDRNGNGVVRAPRMALTLTVGPSDDDSDFALHSCDNRACCNPAHLRWDSSSENLHDQYRRYRRAAKRIELHGVQQDIL